jgi:hypothetical protein
MRTAITEFVIERFWVILFKLIGCRTFYNARKGTSYTSDYQGFINSKPNTETVIGLKIIITYV